MSSDTFPPDPPGFARHEYDNSVVFELGGEAAWQHFVRFNEEALVEQCGSVAAAKATAKTSHGLVMGGGAGLPVFVWLTL